MPLDEDMAQIVDHNTNGAGANAEHGLALPAFGHQVKKPIAARDKANFLLGSGLRCLLG